MNTCAECRFWKDPEDSGPERNLRHQMQHDGGEWKECTRVFIGLDTSRVAVDSSEGMVTRSDFGCVQFERTAIRINTEFSDSLFTK